MKGKRYSTEDKIRVLREAETVDKYAPLARRDPHAISQMEI